jgi:hypothetical protein
VEGSEAEKMAQRIGVLVASNRITGLQLQAGESGPPIIRRDFRR